MSRFVGWLKAAVAVAAAVARRPRLWGTAFRQARVLVPGGWWRRAPFLPLPPGAYGRFRLETVYGGDGRGPVRAEDVVSYLTWCRAWHRAGFR